MFSLERYETPKHIVLCLRGILLFGGGDYFFKNKIRPLLLGVRLFQHAYTSNQDMQLSAHYQKVGDFGRGYKVLISR